MDIFEEQKSVQAEMEWQASEKGRMAAQEKEKAIRSFERTMKLIGKTKGVRSDDPALTMWNKPVIKLNELVQEQREAVDELKALNEKYDLADLLAKKNRFEQRSFQ